MTKTITFSEYAVGTRNPTFNFDDNIITTNGVIVGDGAQPATPVIAANTSYTGPVFVYFENPVESVSVDVGYFDNIGSTRIEFRDAGGNLVASYDNTSYGVVTFSFSSELGIKSVGAIDYSFDDAGFSLDTVVFGPALAVEAPPLVQYAAGPVNADRDFGRVSATTYTFSDTLSATDVADFIHFSAEQAGKATFKTFLADDPTKVALFTLDFTAGVNAFAIRPETAYKSTEAYTVSVSISFAISDKEKAMDEFIDDTMADILSGVLDFKSKQYELFEQMTKIAGNAEDGAKLLGKFGKAFGVLGLGLDIANRADNIAHAANPTKQTFVEVVDMLTGMAATGAVGLGLSAVGTPIAGIIGGFATGIVYTAFLSEGVQGAAGTWYDSLAAGGAPVTILAAAPAEAVVLAAEPDLSAYTLDVDYYLATYADARAAVESGAAANAYFHYLAVGLPNGYKPSAAAEPIPPGAVRQLLANEDPAAGYNAAVFTQAAGALAGDAGSLAEFGFAEYLNDRRTEGTEFGLDATLAVLANRVARDWAINNQQSPREAFDPTAVATWAQTLSNGADFRQALAELVPGMDISSLKILAAYSEGQAPDAIFRALATSPEASSLLLGVENQAIGLAEFGGMWVLIFSPTALGGALQAEASPTLLRLFGGEDQDVLFAGAAPALLHGGAGDDELHGGAFDDVLRGGTGNDILKGGGGSNELDGGEGWDIVDHGTIGRREGGAFSAGAGGTTLHAWADGGTDTLRSVEVVQYVDGRMVFDAQGPEAQLLRLYDAAFDRAPDQEGLNGWLAQIGTGTTLRTVAEGFIASGEFATAFAGLDNAAFVERLYANALGRVAEAEGKAFWTTLLDAGTSRAEALLQFSTAAEHLAVTQPLVQAGIWDVNETAVQVARLYDAALGRLPDMVGLADHVGTIEDGLATLESVAALFLASAELQAVYGGLDNAAFVEALYLNALGRQGEEGGRAFWASELEGGLSRANVLAGFSESDEHQALTRANTMDPIQPGIVFA